MLRASRAAQVACWRRTCCCCGRRRWSRRMRGACCRWRRAWRTGCCPHLTRRPASRCPGSTWCMCAPRLALRAQSSGPGLPAASSHASGSCRLEDAARLAGEAGAPAPSWPVQEAAPCGPLSLQLTKHQAASLPGRFPSCQAAPHRQGVLPGETRVTCTACAGTLLLEFGALSRLTGSPVYEDLARNATLRVFGAPPCPADLHGACMLREELLCSSNREPDRMVFCTCRPLLTQRKSTMGAVQCRPAPSHPRCPLAHMGPAAQACATRAPACWAPRWTWTPQPGCAPPPASAPAPTASTSTCSRCAGASCARARPRQVAPAGMRRRTGPPVLALWYSTAPRLACVGGRAQRAHAAAAHASLAGLSRRAGRGAQAYLLLGDQACLAAFCEAYAAAMRHLRPADQRLPGFPTPHRFLRAVGAPGEPHARWVSSLSAFWPGLQALVGARPPQQTCLAPSPPHMRTGLFKCPTVLFRMPFTIAYWQGACVLHQLPPRRLHRCSLHARRR